MNSFEIMKNKHRGIELMETAFTCNRDAITFIEQHNLQVVNICGAVGCLMINTNDWMKPFIAGIGFKDALGNVAMADVSNNMFGDSFESQLKAHKADFENKITKREKMTAEISPDIAVLGFLARIINRDVLLSARERTVTNRHTSFHHGVDNESISIERTGWSLMLPKTATRDEAQLDVQFSNRAKQIRRRA